MKNRHRIAVISYLMLSIMLPAASEAAVILETATISGPEDRVGGVGVYADQWFGASFRLLEPTRITGVGTYVAGFGGHLFAALVELGPSGVPSFNPYEIESYALAAVTFPTAGPECRSPGFCRPGPSTDILVPLSLLLDAGSYGLLVGSGKFGADDGGAYWMSGLVPNGASDLLAAYDRGPAGMPLAWGSSSGERSTIRFVVLGESVSPVPEPSTLPLLGTALAVWAASAYLSRRPSRNRSA